MARATSKRSSRKSGDFVFMGFGWVGGDRKSEVSWQIKKLAVVSFQSSAKAIGWKSERERSSLRAGNGMELEITAMPGTSEAVSNGLRAVMTRAKMRGRGPIDKTFRVKLS